MMEHEWAIFIFLGLDWNFLVNEAKGQVTLCNIVCVSHKALLPVLPPLQATSGFAAKSRTEFYFVQHVAATCNTEICCLQGGNTGNKALQRAKQQCCTTSCKEMLPILLPLFRG